MAKAVVNGQSCRQITSLDSSGRRFRNTKIEIHLSTMLPKMNLKLMGSSKSNYKSDFYMHYHRIHLRWMVLLHYYKCIYVKNTSSFCDSKNHRQNRANEMNSRRRKNTQKITCVFFCFRLDMKSELFTARKVFNWNNERNLHSITLSVARSHLSQT